jgi:hypothetical protein
VASHSHAAEPSSPTSAAKWRGSTAEWGRWRGPKWWGSERRRAKHHALGHVVTLGQRDGHVFAHLVEGPENLLCLFLSLFIYLISFTHVQNYFFFVFLMFKNNK